MTVSAVCELYFALFVAQCKVPYRQGHCPDWVESLVEEHHELIGRIAGFWPDDAYTDRAEVLHLAQRSGTLLDDRIEPFFDRLDAAMQEYIVVPATATESEDVPGIISSRLEQLRHSPERRHQFGQLLRDFWDLLRPYWDGGGLAVAIAAREALTASLAGNGDLRAVVPAGHFIRRQEFVQVVERAQERGEVALVPLALAPEGKLFYELPNLVLIGFGPDAELPDARRREQAEQVAARLKVLSDPTRVTLLSVLLSGPSSVTDLAARFDLSQPTVSMHIKLLREANLLDLDKRGNQTLYHASEDRVRRLLSDAAADLFKR